MTNDLNNILKCNSPLAFFNFSEAKTDEEFIQQCIAEQYKVNESTSIQVIPIGLLALKEGGFFMK